jgi:iron complex outermembrane receptor protein
MLLQNVGAITNRGWELQSTATVGRLALDGTLSLVDSRVQQTATDYVGELRSGDRMLGVPRRTLGLTASWTGTRWSGSVGASRASDWIDYDRLALARDLATAPSGDALGAGRLRHYWRRYGGVTRLRASFARELRGGIGLLLTGENLLDRQRGEPDDLTILPGRTITVGLQARF